MRRIYYVTGTRADYGLMQSTLRAINECDGLDLSLVVTGMHLSKKYGLTVNEIKKAAFNVIAKIPIPFSKNDSANMAVGVGKIILACTRLFQENRPDVVLVLGDRGEMLAATIAAVHLGIPVVHLHGGERSGTIDESVRHAISKLANYHFVATQQSKRRLMKMGEKENNIFVTGAPGLDHLKLLARFNKSHLCQKANLPVNNKTILFLYHPVLQEQASIETETKHLLYACLKTKANIVCIMPNSDAGSDKIREILTTFSEQPNVYLCVNMPREEFVSWMDCCDVMVGNSSSGIIEAATFCTPVINVGSRQRLRERNRNVIDVESGDMNFEKTLNQCLNAKRRSYKNVYGDETISAKISSLLMEINISPEALYKINTY
jgi:GDP/UDP-N,N'-diacetylbacillosamine 2-epimerase (hydrolysing)